MPHQVLLHTQLASDKQELSRLIVMLEELHASFGQGDTTFYNFLIAITEAVNNAIIHGNKLDAAKSVDVKIEKSDAGIRCSIQDQGAGFDEHNVANPVDPENLLAEGGRGVFIIRALMSDVMIENTGSGTRISFTCATT